MEKRSCRAKEYDRRIENHKCIEYVFLWVFSFFEIVIISLSLSLSFAYLNKTLHKMKNFEFLL